MAEASLELEGPDFEKGCESKKVSDGEMLLGHAFGEAILVARRGEELFAIGATCTHYGGPLAKGLMVDCTVHCPWHHARFDLRTGEAIAAPAPITTTLAGDVFGFRGSFLSILPVTKNRSPRFSIL